MVDLVPHDLEDGCDERRATHGERSPNHVAAHLHPVYRQPHRRAVLPSQRHLGAERVDQRGRDHAAQHRADGDRDADEEHAPEHGMGLAGGRVLHHALVEAQESKARDQRRLVAEAATNWGSNRKAQRGQSE
eukprot:192878-Prymnesium_polylepis.2